MTDILRSSADEVAGQAKSYYFESKGVEYMLEILSRSKARDEEIYQILLKEFLADEDKISLRAGYLAAYGDDRALPYLLNKIEDMSIGFVTFQELKYAIEALGGEYNEPRDFSADKDYIAIENAGYTSTDEYKN